MLRFDRGPDRVDPLAVLGPQVAGGGAEGLGEVPRYPVERIQRGQRPGEHSLVHLVPIGLDVAPREHFGVPGHVEGRDEPAPLLELLRDPGGAGEQVERPARAGRTEHLAEDGHEASLRAQVLDHRSDGIGRRVVDCANAGW